MRDMHVLSVTTTPSAWVRTHALEKGHIRTALGLHPEIAHLRRAELQLFDKLLPIARFVGEVGLDGASELRSHWSDQVYVFQHITASCSRAGGRIMSIHSRNAASHVLEILNAHGSGCTPVLHWFSGNTSDLDRAIDLGCWFSVGPAMLSASRGRKLVARMPKDRVLPESDGPFTRLGSKPMFPWHTDIVLRQLSSAWEMQPDRIENLFARNLENLLGSSGL